MRGLESKMQMNELRSCLIKETDRLVKDFAEKNNFTILKCGEYKEFTSWTLSCASYRIEFVFTVKKKFFLPVHTLFVRLFLNPRFPDYFHISEILDIIEPNNYKSYCYPYLESVETLNVCFEDLSRFLSIHLDDFAEIADDYEKLDFLVERKREDIIRNMSLLESEKELMKKKGGHSRENVENIIENYMFYEKIELVDRFTGENNPYCLFLKGKHEKAVNKLQRAKIKNRYFSFENRLLDYLETKPKVARKDIIPAEVDTLANIDSYKKQESREGFISGLILYIACVLAMLAIRFGFEAFYKSTGALLVLEPPVWTVFIFAALPSMFGSYALKNMIIRLLKIKRVDSYDGFFDGEKAKTFVRIVFTIIGTLTFMVYIGLCLGATRIYKDKMVLPTDLNDIVPISFEEKKLDDVEAMYFIEGRYNEDGDYIDRSSYVLKFSDGYLYDFDRDCSVAYAEDKILPLIESYYNKVTEVKSDREIQ